MKIWVAQASKKGNSDVDHLTLPGITELSKLSNLKKKTILSNDSKMIFIIALNDLNKITKQVKIHLLQYFLNHIYIL